ncbi:MAG: hypothetical protein WEF53_06175 [Bacteroidota bacterium]
MRILAVNPGGRYVGLAVFYGSDLRDWRVRSLGRTPRNDREKVLINLVSKTIRIHGANALVIKAFHPARSPQHLRSLVRKVKEIAKAEGLRIRELSINELKAKLGSNGCANKRDLMENVAARYPFLYPELEREKKCKTHYPTRMFEAVALGAAISSDLEQKGR